MSVVISSECIGLHWGLASTESHSGAATPTTRGSLDDQVVVSEAGRGAELTSAAALLTTCGEWFTGLGLRLLHCQGPRALEQMCLHVQPAGSSVVATATTSPGRVVPSPSSKEKLNCHHHGRNRSWASGSSGSTLRGAGQLPRTSRHCARCRTTRSGPSARPARMPRASPARRSESPRCSPTMRSWWLSPMST